MRFKPLRALASSTPVCVPRAALPAHLAFLAAYAIDPEPLCAATARAVKDGVDGLQALLAGGEVGETRYYLCLAHRLGIPFMTDWPHLEPSLDVRIAASCRRVRLSQDPRAAWLIAPSAEEVELLLAARARGLRLPSIAVTTPSHLSALLRHRAQARIAYRASRALPEESPRLSAHGAIDRVAIVTISIALACVALSALGGLRLPAVILGGVFLASLIFRLVVTAEGLAQEPDTIADDIADMELPHYSVLVPLRDEPAVVPNLVAALSALDYPRSKLEVFFLIEADDASTREALRKLRLPPGFAIFEVPAGVPGTKPRALNAGLLLSLGELVTVYDAEDRPEPDQLRRAAALFARSRSDVACLQARLAIYNSDNGLLPRLFAIEYAALFDIFNVGLARLGLPIGLGGTSNHFRASALHIVGGWDAWNVTEDADLGLRLARFGFQIDMLASTTWEDAPERFGVWFKQRRRWTKGWMQTLVVLARDLGGTARDLGVRRTLAVALMLTNLVTGPLLTPFFLVLVLWRLGADGLPNPKGLPETLEATLAYSVLALGAVGTFWSGWVGAERRGLATIGSLVAFLPYQLLICAAAWGGIWDLARRPYHWHKTNHDDASTRGPRLPPDGVPNESGPIERE